MRFKHTAYLQYTSLVPRPSAAPFLVAYVTFEPPSDKLAEGLVPLLYTYVIYKQSGHGYEATRLHVYMLFQFMLLPQRQQLDANSALTAIQHALTFDYSGVPSAW